MGRSTRAYRGSYTGGQIANEANATKYQTALTTTGFGVFSYFTGAKDYRSADYTWTVDGVWKKDNTAKYPNFMYNQELTYDTTKDWVYSPVKYWPNGIDADNAGNPSYTATQKDEGKLSFFAYAPFTTVEGDAYTATAEGDGIAPDDVTAKKTGNENGITAMTTNESLTDVWVKYAMTNAAANKAVDLLWGLNGKTTYDETDGDDPAVGAIGTAYNENLTKQKVGEKVKFLFKHALAKVGGATANGDEALDGDPAQCGFKVVVDVDKNSNTPGVNGQSNQTTYFNSDFSNAETLVTIKEVKIRDAYTYTVTEDETDNLTNENGLPNFGWFDIETGKWSDKTETSGTSGNGATYSITANQNTNLADDTYTLNEKVKEVTTYEKHQTTQTDGAKYLVDGDNAWDTSVMPSGVTLQPTPLFTNENVPGLLLIPSQDAVLYITVDYIVRTADPNLAAGFTEVEQVITNKVTLSAASIDPNKYYTIIMHLGLTSVKFEAKVTDWTTTADATFDENGNVTEGSVENTDVVWLPSNVVSANAWSISKSTASYAAKGGDITLTVSMNSTDLSYDTTAAAGKYTLAKVGTADWLTIDADGKLTAAANTTTSKRTATVNVTTVVNGNTITTPITLEQAGFALNLTASIATVTVKNGDEQNVTEGYTVSVTGGDGKGAETHSAQTITVTGTPGQTYTVTVTHTASGATATTTVTLPTAP